MAVEAGELEVGTRVAGRYTVQEPISSGAMGAVYRAQRDDGGTVALKLLLDPGQSARFEIEGRLLARLRHPRVVRVIEHVDDAGSQYLVMELVEGSDLNRLLAAQGSPGLPLDDVLTYAREAAEALQYVHAQQVVHRDVKPHNLIRAEHGVVLVDFGIAREQVPGDPGTRAVGTPLYMAPEVLVGEGISPRSDVYGLAATVWALLTGKPPAYHDETRLTGVPAGFERTLRAALDLRPERRPASVEAFVAGLGSPLAKEGEGESLALSLAGGPAPRPLLEAIVHAAAGVFEAAAASIALLDEATGELVYQASWGAGADEIVGVRLPPGMGIAGSVVESGEGRAVPDCRADPSFGAAVARGTGYVPHTMLVAPLRRGGHMAGVLSILDRRDGGAYQQADLQKAQLFAELAEAALVRP